MTISSTTVVSLCGVSYDSNHNCERWTQHFHCSSPFGLELAGCVKYCGSSRWTNPMFIDFFITFIVKNLLHLLLPVLLKEKIPMWITARSCQSDYEVNFTSLTSLCCNATLGKQLHDSCAQECLVDIWRETNHLCPHDMSTDRIPVNKLHKKFFSDL